MATIDTRDHLRTGNNFLVTGGIPAPQRVGRRAAATQAPGPVGCRRVSGGYPKCRAIAFHIGWIVATVLLTLYSAPAAAAQVAIIANKSVPVDSVSQSEVLEIYTGELREWKNGSPIVVYDLTAEGTVRDQFYEFIGRKSSRIKSIWMKNLLMGEGSPPESLKTEEDVLGRVAKTPGAIGFVRPEMANDSVKILAVVTPLTGSD